jgi:hypothetical protein
VSQLPDALVQVVRALLADEDLAIWFESLGDVSLAQRAAEFRQMSARMQAAGSDTELAQAVGLLAVPGAYEGVLAAFHELRDSL